MNPQVVCPTCGVEASVPHGAREIVCVCGDRLAILEETTRPKEPVENLDERNLTPRERWREESLGADYGSLAVAMGIVSIITTPICLIGTPFAVAAIFYSLAARRRGVKRHASAALVLAGISMAGSVLFTALFAYNLL